MVLDPPGGSDCIYYKLVLTSGKSSLSKEKRNDLCKNGMFDSKHGGMATLDGEFKNSKLINIINSSTGVGNGEILNIVQCRRFKQNPTFLVVTKNSIHGNLNIKIYK